jgi:hypothetical protein
MEKTTYICGNIAICEGCCTLVVETSLDDASKVRPGQCPFGIYEMVNWEIEEKGEDVK